MKQTQNQFYGKKSEMPSLLPKGSIYVCLDTEELYYSGNSQIPKKSGLSTQQVQNSISQGYFGLLTDFYFDGAATETVIELNDVDTWVDVNFAINAGGKFDYRPQSMKEVDPIGYDEVTQQFNLEGLTLENFGSFRASMSFDPDEDDGELSARLQFQRHSGAIPNDPFPIEDIVASMAQGADTDYPIEPFLTFFIGDTIDTNGPGDAGKCKFQIKSSVPGIVSMRALTWYINR